MIGFYDIAKMIPASFRADILHGNYIYKAVADEADTHMIVLFIVYKNYIEPNNEQYQFKDGKIINACKLCLTNILDKFKILEPYLIQIEKEYQLLEA